VLMAQGLPRVPGENTLRGCSHQVSLLGKDEAEELNSTSFIRLVCRWAWFCSGHRSVGFSLVGENGEKLKPVVLAQGRFSSIMYSGKKHSEELRPGMLRVVPKTVSLSLI
jgi:hypothetical protein